MVKSKSRSRKDKSGKPDKPYPDFPLFPHATKRWAKKIRGKLHYFGPWDNPQAALNKYLEQKDALFAGRKPRQTADGFTLADLCNHFLNSKTHLVDNRELTQRSWDDYQAACDRIIEAFGGERLVEDLRPDDFEEFRAKMAARGWGPVTLHNAIRRTRCIFRFAADNQLIPRPVCFGTGFRPPTQKTLRENRNRKGLQMFEAAEIRAMLDKAGTHLKAMVLLGINCGFGNSDVGNLPLSALELERSWVNYPRPKTGVCRRCPLWPETVDALREAIAKRPAPKINAAAGLVFVTQRGAPWFKAVMENPVSKEMRKLLDGLKINGRRNFYCLRHTFETIAGETERQVAVDYLMGHSARSDDMAAVYRERIGDDRLRAVTDHVRDWLFGGSEMAGAGATGTGEEESLTAEK